MYSVNDVFSVGVPASGGRAESDYPAEAGTPTRRLYALH